MSAASKLVGLPLNDGWVVTQHLARNPNGSGGTFSESYEARLGDRNAFVKAFDFSKAFEPDRDTLDELNKLTAAYMHEHSILEHCKERRLSRVVSAIGHGSVQIPGMSQMEGRVYYLLFGKADGDVRCQMDLSKRLDTLWCLQALKDVSLGLWQVHKEMIAHQDTKPSNVLVYKEGGFKVADFGRSSRMGHNARHDDFRVAGDRGYAPPEQMYGMIHEEFVPRRMGCDLYMLGNLIGFLFSGVNLNAEMMSRLDPGYHPRTWGGTYAEALPFVIHAFNEAVDEIKSRIDPLVRDDLSDIIYTLCNPDLSKRGHPKGAGARNQFSLERYVAQIDLITKRYEVKIRSAARSAVAA